MVKRILKILNWEISGLHEAAFLLGLSALSSQTLALLRDRLLASTFGASKTLDIYYASFRIPDLIFISVGSFLAVTVVIPIIISKMEEGGGVEKARDFLGNILAVFLILIITVSFIAFFMMPWLVDWVAPGFDDESKVLMIKMSQILLLSPFFLGLSNLFGSVTQSFKKFFVYALSPIFYNLGIITGIVLFYPKFGLPGLAYGVVFGAFLHFLIQLPVVSRLGMLPHLIRKINMGDFRKVCAMSLPRTLALGVNQLAIMYLTALGSFMKVGSIAVFNFSFNLQSVPLAIIGVSYSVAALPEMSRIYAKRNIAEFVSYVENAFKHIVFWSVPITVLFIVLRAQIVRTILGAGMFSWNDTRLTVAVLAIFSVSVIAQNLIQLLDRVYYATGDTIKPVVTKIISSVLIIIFGYFLVELYSGDDLFKALVKIIFRVEGVAGTEILMLPLAFSLGTIFNLLTLFSMFLLDFKTFSKKFILTSLQVIISSAIMGFVSYRLLNIMSFFMETDTTITIFLQGFVAGIVGIVVNLLILRIMGNPEYVEIEKTLMSKFWKTTAIMPGPDEVGS